MLESEKSQESYINPLSHGAPQVVNSRSKYLAGQGRDPSRTKLIRSFGLRHEPISRIESAHMLIIRHSFVTPRFTNGNREHE
jgi:hypothetical protein